MTKGYSSLPIKAVALATGLGLGFLSYPILAASGSGGDTVRGLYDVLLNTMKSGHALGQSGRFMQLAPVIHRSFDIVSMVRLAVGPSWASLTEARRAAAARLSVGSTPRCSTKPETPPRRRAGRHWCSTPTATRRRTHVFEDPRLEITSSLDIHLGTQLALVDRVRDRSDDDAVRRVRALPPMAEGWEEGHAG